MYLKEYLLGFLALAFSPVVCSDSATYDPYWQWNKNVKIEKVIVYWETSDTRIFLSNGEICKISKTDKELYSAALAARAQGLSGEVLCQKDPVEGNAERRVHRLAF
ncbi:hypothetical protein [Teredinibacter sp. KSP-S5-2]|uniref:hypothetical protein n=1 Tax=Teredinibacter sp. KSP-S5-2 TaxID=3034506 RepID=UPI0029348E03|nr:hypothetical protein [Teredinibacter sp. KSP-S5-2]WNO07955.1 hypothetical protein P5V12_13305 [Teredinibacter sp. KSP-S5-2]